MTESQYIDKKIISTFRENNLKVTPQRIAIAKYVLNNSEHPTAKRIYQEIRMAHPTVSVATIYATLKVLKEIGFIQELNLPDGQSRFDPNLEPHAHLICEKCGDITDWEDPLLSELVSNISNDAHFIVSASGLNLNGVCRKCQEDENT
ncbi:MAG: ferric uptake regulator [Methanomethylovorans sp. PtaU1.Bin093]|jgi:Fur family peroxide stress response transcriptional regulator|uniref:Fur family transcriptional regulator n=1 Tax=Methanomethylovorans sp. PtaU1.Bin093 TaxID=1811679 RepID=UPI0009C5785D|nr:Fur family transcriptional regulator [Methanomethylovorans sp. PtaU1.Bin093]OPY21577.1 MAG: ferric uptake regulator [Methanomethylovorans sp. PtaU1.Bin093]